MDYFMGEYLYFWGTFNIIVHVDCGLLFLNGLNMFETACCQDLRVILPVAIFVCIQHEAREVVPARFGSPPGVKVLN